MAKRRKYQNTRLVTVTQSGFKDKPKAGRPRAPNDRPMAGPLLRAWRSEMGLSERDASRRLGMSRGGLRNAEADGGPLYLAYACAALIAGIKPYGMPDYQLRLTDETDKIDAGLEEAINDANKRHAKKKKRKK